MPTTATTLTATMIVNEPHEVRAWVVEHLTVKELDTLTCPHCGNQEGVSCARLDQITTAIIAGDAPAWGATGRSTSATSTAICSNSSGARPSLISATLSNAGPLTAAPGGLPLGRHSEDTRRRSPGERADAGEGHRDGV